MKNQFDMVDYTNNLLRVANHFVQRKPLPTICKQCGNEGAEIVCRICKTNKREETT